jgi:hypothetical protein
MKFFVIGGGQSGNRVAGAVNRRLKLIRNELPEAMEDVKADLIKRTKGGTDIAGGQFKSYSKSWAAVRRAEGLQTSTPDLTFTGAMLNALRVKSYRNAAEIYFESRAEARKASENQRLRAFFGWTKRAVEILVNRLRSAK